MKSFIFILVLLMMIPIVYAPPLPPDWVGSLTDSPDPITIGKDIEYNGTGNDPDDDDYYLHVCRTDAINDEEMAACNTGQTLCVSEATADEVEATCNHTTKAIDIGTLIGYGFLCDSTGRCTTVSVDATTTVYPIFGTLNVNITSPLNDSDWNEGDNDLTINATVTCEGSINATCGTVYASARYNLSSIPDTLISSAVMAKPFNINKGGSWGLEKTLTEAGGDTRDVAFSPDVKLLAYSSADDDVYVHNLNDWSLNTTLTESVGDARDVAFSPDGNLIAYASNDGNIYIHNTSDWSLNKTLTEATGDVRDVMFSPDNKFIAYGGTDNKVYVHNVSDWSLNATLTEAGGSIWGVEFSPDSKLLAYSSIDDNIYIHNVNDWSLNATLSNATGDTIGISFSLDGKFIAYATAGLDGDVYVHNTDDWSLNTTLEVYISDTLDVAFSPDSKLLAYTTTGVYHDAYVYNVDDWSLNVTLIVPESSWAAEFSSDNNLLALANHNDNVYVYAVNKSHTQTKDMNLSDNWNVTWALSVTSSSTESYLIDVNFTSSYGDSHIPSNDTANILVNLNPSVEEDICDCPDSPSHWVIDDGSICTLEAGTTCDICPYVLIIQDSTFLHYGMLKSGGIYHDYNSVYFRDYGGGWFKCY